MSVNEDRRHERTSQKYDERLSPGIPRIAPASSSNSILSGVDLIYGMSKLDFELRSVKEQQHISCDPMTIAKAALDPLWHCLCPVWTEAVLARVVIPRPRRPLRCVNAPRLAPSQRRAYAETGIYNPVGGPPARGNTGKQDPDLASDHVSTAVTYPLPSTQRKEKSVGSLGRRDRAREELLPDLKQLPTGDLYTRIHEFARTGKVDRCRVVAEYLVEERKEKPSVLLYTALISSNTSHLLGGAWKVGDYLEEMREAGIHPDAGVCHAVLKVCSVHPDHLIRTDILHYMKARWIQLSEDGARDVVVGLLREGLFEQALERLDAMSTDGTPIPAWLWDMAIFTLCDVGEVEEATRILRHRVDAGETHISKSVWYRLLDQASIARYHSGTAFAWNSQVNTGYMSPSSGICLNVLSTTSHAGDAVLGTDVFAHLSKRGVVFQPVHYEQLITCYLSAHPPDPNRAISILTIMALEKLDPSPSDTRSLYLHFRDEPTLVNSALIHLRGLLDQGRRIPIAALNLLIECYIHQQDLSAAMKIYKLIHTFVPLGDRPRKSFANIETFNFLLRGCRSPPDADLASFLVSELLALNIRPTALTYDRLILVFLSAATELLTIPPPSDDSIPSSPPSPAKRTRGLELLDWSFRHFIEMQHHLYQHLPRFGTMRKLAVELASVGDGRCWDVLQVGEDRAEEIEGWPEKGQWVRRDVEQAWKKGDDLDTIQVEADNVHIKADKVVEVAVT